MRGLRPKKTILVVFASYIILYLVLSRIGFQWAKATNSSGFYFVVPLGTVSAVVNYTCVVVFYPLIVVDNLLGTGMPFDKESGWGEPALSNEQNGAFTSGKGITHKYQNDVDVAPVSKPESKP